MNPPPHTSDQTEILRRLLAKDASLWTDDPEEQAKVRDRLGWLTLHDSMAVRRAEFEAFGQEVRTRGYQRAVLLGMGGSSLAPEVLQATFGAAPGRPELTVLDTTDPASILAVERSLDLMRTLFIISSKSGTTLETISLFRYFAAKVRTLSGGPLDNFVAITDPGTPLEELATEQRLWRCFLNPPDVGGRYSALSYVGLVPAAIIGVDIRLLLDSARRLDLKAGLGLGAALAELAGNGRDKVTFLPGGLPGFGAWAEQLLAESTGKDGKGLIPVDGEPVGRPEVYADDRAFVRMRAADRLDALDEQVQALEAAGHPVITIDMPNAYDLGAEFLRWEIATATAGALFGVNPFDEPDVQEAKDATAAILAQGSLDPDGGGETLTPHNGPLLLAAARGATPGSYFAIQAFLQRKPENDDLLARIRASVRFPTHLATTAGYGPRYLHSTGQLHKGGTDRAVFLQLTADDPEDLPIPESPYGFGMLKRAQALGDFRALQSKGRRVMRLHLGDEPTAGLARLVESIQQSAAPTATPASAPGG
ncbi:MAG: glucose-6-phosphate isomerase [Chloroflexi bacterium]|nr:MAG: glucose-6-phosphate isomerase [Chloroflexota bacterium]